MDVKSYQQSKPPHALVSQLMKPGLAKPAAFWLMMGPFGVLVLSRQCQAMWQVLEVGWKGLQPNWHVVRAPRSSQWAPACLGP